MVLHNSEDPLEGPSQAFVSKSATTSAKKRRRAAAAAAAAAADEASDELQIECLGVYCDNQPLPLREMASCPAGHMFCAGCLEEETNQSMEDGGVEGLTCMADNCRALFDMEEVEMLIRRLNYDCNYEEQNGDEIQPSNMAKRKGKGKRSNKAYYEVSTDSSENEEPRVNGGHTEKKFQTVSTQTDWPKRGDLVDGFTQTETQTTEDVERTTVKDDGNDDGGSTNDEDDDNDDDVEKVKNPRIRKMLKARRKLAKEIHEAQDCSFCSETLIQEEGKSFQCPASHAFCRNCLTEACRSAKDKKESGFFCLNNSCDARFDISVVSSLLGEEDVVTWLKNGYDDTKSKAAPLARDNTIVETEGAKPKSNSGVVVECLCCYDDVDVNSMLACKSGHLFCRDCVKRGSQVAMGDGKPGLECLGQCKEQFELFTLSRALSEVTFDKWSRKIQIAEVEKANLEGLEQCPFCDFATIIDDKPSENKVFRCENPDCGKESCRLCKEPNHVPLKCDEVEKDAEVAKRTFIENKMTEAIMRKCWSCNKVFLKDYGCNMMTCECGAKQCYVCRAQVKDYSHFGNKKGQCRLHTDADKMHKEELRQGGFAAKAQMDEENPDIDLKFDPLAGFKKPRKKKEPLPPRKVIPRAAKRRRAYNLDDDDNNNNDANIQEEPAEEAEPAPETEPEPEPAPNDEPQLRRSKRIRKQL